MKRKTIIILSATLVTLALTACGNEATSGEATGASQAEVSQEEVTGTTETEYGNTEYDGLQSYTEYAGIEPAADSEDVKTITIAYGYSAYPIAYTTKDGGVSGYDIEMLKAVDALLPDYKFEFVPSAGGDDLLLGVQSGKTNGAVRNWFQTEERKQIFSFPEKNIGLSVTGLTVKKENVDTIYDFATVSEAGGYLVPVDPGDGHYTVLKKWCEANPDKAWDFETGQLTNSADAYAWVAEGRYDAYFSLEVSFNALVTAENGSAHQYADQLTWVPCAAIPTYVIFSADDKAVADAFDSVIDQIWDSGYANYIQENLYGVDYIALYGRDGLGFSE